MTGAIVTILLAHHVRKRSENVAFGAVSCATVPISSEGGPAK